MLSIVIFIPQIAFSQTIGETKNFLKTLGITNRTTSHNTTSTSSQEFKAVYVAPKTISKLNQYDNNTVSSSEQNLVNSTLPCSKCQKPWILIPSWVKNNAKWWSQGQVSDDEFVKAIQYLIQQAIMTIPQTQSSSNSSQTMPSWIKTNAGWWADGQISDAEFVKGIQYLISDGIINVNSNSTASETQQCASLSTPADRETCLEQAAYDAKIKSTIARAVPYAMGPVTFYYAGSQTQQSDNGKSILTLHFVVEDTSYGQVTMSCTSQDSCNYGLSDGQRDIPYSTNTLVYGSLTLVPKTPTFVDWTYYDLFDTQRNYTFYVNEPWGTGSIPLKIQW